MTPQQIASGYDRGIVWSRWSATVVDVVALVALLGLFWFPRASEQDARADLFFALVGGYYVLLEGLLGATLGKLLVGLRIVDSAGHRPGVHRIFIRTLLRLIEVNPVAAGGLPAGLFVLYTKDRQRLGDILAGTYVLRVRDLAKLDGSKGKER